MHFRVPGCAHPVAPATTRRGTKAESWEALMSDGDPAQMAPGAMRPMPPPARGAVGRSVLSERRLQRLAAGAVDVRRLQRIEHRARRHGVHVPAPPAFRSVSAACAAGIAGAAVKLAADEDIIYSPDQPDYVFDQGLTVAAWIKPDASRRARRAIARKRFDGTSSFVLGIDAKKLVFALKLTNGKTVGVSTGGLAAPPVHAHRRHVRRQ